MANDPNDGIGLDDLFGGGAPAEPQDPSDSLELETREPKKTEPPPSVLAGAQPNPGPSAQPTQPMSSELAETLPASQGGPIRALPPQRKSKASRFVFLFAICALAGGAALFFMGEKEKPVEVAEEAPAEKELPEVDLKELAQKRPKNAPACWQSNDGYRFAYVDGANERQVVAKIEEVPSLYRAAAACRAE